MVKIHGVHYAEDIDYLVNAFGYWFESECINSLSADDLVRLAKAFHSKSPTHYQFMILETDVGDIILDTADNGDTIHQYTFKEFEEMVFSLISESNKKGDD